MFTYKSLNKKQEEILFKLNNKNRLTYFYSIDTYLPSKYIQTIQN